MSGNIKAFPSGLAPYNGDQYPINDGMDLRDYFAAKAMQAFINASLTAYCNENLSRESCLDDNVASIAYLYADAMMKARNANHE